MNPSHILKQPIITEKSLQDAANHVFTFEVAKTANKDQIKTAVQLAYNVDVVKITTTTTPSKSYSTGRRRLVKSTTLGKKARIQLKPGQKINLFEIEES